MQVFSFLLLVICGFAAYLFRARNRFGYGIVEFMTAIGLMVIAVFHPEPGHLLLSNGSPFGIFLSNSLSYAASIYLMVRGLDNMESDLPIRWRPTWARFFSKNHH